MTKAYACVRYVYEHACYCCVWKKKKEEEEDTQNTLITKFQNSQLTHLHQCFPLLLLGPPWSPAGDKRGLTGSWAALNMFTRPNRKQAKICSYSIYTAVVTKESVHLVRLKKGIRKDADPVA